MVVEIPEVPWHFSELGLFLNKEGAAEYTNKFTRLVSCFVIFVFDLHLIQYLFHFTGKHSLAHQSHYLSLLDISGAVLEVSRLNLG